MNVAVVFAGGVGKRMNSGGTPKQFLELHGKPIIIYTLEVFQKCEKIDAICISCLDAYRDYMHELCNRFGITKVQWIVAGGATGQESIYNGLHEVWQHCDRDTVVLIHDGVRPIISTDLVERNIASVEQNGNAISCSRAIETPAEVDENGVIRTVSDRQCAIIAKAPQSFRLGDIHDAHTKAREEQKGDFIDSASMMRHYGHVLHMVECNWDNIKITSPTDYYIFRALAEARENSQIFGL